MKILNEEFIPLQENMKFTALSQLRELQSNLVGISFLPVISIMKETNPLKKTVLAFQDDLDKLTMDIQDFISKAKNDIDYNETDEPEDDEPVGDEEVGDDEKEDDEPVEDDEKKDDETKKDKKVVDTSESTI